MLWLGKLLDLRVSDMSEENKANLTDKFMQDFAEALVKSQETYIEEFKKEKYKELQDELRKYEKYLTPLQQNKGFKKIIDKDIVSKICFDEELSNFPDKIKLCAKEMQDIKKSVKARGILLKEDDKLFRPSRRNFL